MAALFKNVLLNHDFVTVSAIRAATVDGFDVHRTAILVRMDSFSADNDKKNVRWSLGRVPDTRE